jgi:hypothetical protein
MSGAALAPSMGKLTRSSLRFLMCMANVRLGVWVPNPRRMGKFVTVRPDARRNAKGFAAKVKVACMSSSQLIGEVRQDASEPTGEPELTAKLEHTAKHRLMPRPTPKYLIKELFGWNSVNDKFLYVTDGGHYENLGLVELLRRGCSRVYCFDASAGKRFGALGDAIALARSELGVEITFTDNELATITENKKGFAAQRCATGTIEYTRSTSGALTKSGRVSGRLIYAPTVMTEALPWDVQAFKQADSSFPHDSTLDQLFTDQKFEAYRILGRYAARSAIEAMNSSVPSHRSVRRVEGVAVAT